MPSELALSEQYGPGRSPGQVGFVVVRQEPGSSSPMQCGCIPDGRLANKVELGSSCGRAANCEVGSRNRQPGRPRPVNGDAFATHLTHAQAYETEARCQMEATGRAAKGTAPVGNMHLAEQRHRFLRPPLTTVDRASASMPMPGMTGLKKDPRYLRPIKAGMFQFAERLQHRRQQMPASRKRWS